MSDAQRMQVLDSTEQLEHYIACRRLSVAELVSRHDSIEQITTLQVNK